MPKTIFYRNFKKITQYGTTEKKPGSGRPQALTPDKRSLYQRALQYPLSSTAKITGSKGCSSVDAHCLSNFEDGRHFQEKTTENSFADRRPKQNRFSFYQTWLVDNFFATVFITDESFSNFIETEFCTGSKVKACETCTSILPENYGVECSQLSWTLFQMLRTSGEYWERRR